MKKKDKAIAITPNYQRLFVIGVVGGWVLVELLLTHQLMSHYTSTGTWIFHTSTLLFPALIFIASLGFASKRYVLWLQRLFFGALLTTAVMSVYEIVDWLGNEWYTRVYTLHHPLGSNASYWQTFGNEWTLMGVSLAVYIGCLLWIQRRRT